MADIRVLGYTFPSVEHAYMHTQAINAKKPDVAKQVLEAKYAHTVKRISRDIPFNPSWEERKEGIMDKILHAKLDQCASFRDSLKDSGDKVLVGAAPGDFFWGSGLNATHTAHSVQERWPGQNKLGAILQRLRQKLEEEEQTFAKLRPTTRSVSQTPLAS
jgi:ribA/ribD-fused uncharacterized protein